MSEFPQISQNYSQKDPITPQFSPVPFKSNKFTKGQNSTWQFA